MSWPGYAMYEVVRQKNLAPNYDLNLTIFEDPIGGHSALAAGQIDIYLCTGDYTPITIDSNTPVTNVAFLNPSYGVDHIVLSPNQEIKALKGKKVSAPQAYIGHLLMGLFLEKNGIPVDDEHADNHDYGDKIEEGRDDNEYNYGHSNDDIEKDSTTFFNTYISMKPEYAR